MTTFTTEDRILAEKDGSLTINVNAGEVTASPPHIVDSGASVMNNEPVAWIDPYDLERLPHHDCWVNGQEHKNSVPLYTYPAKTLTDEEITQIVSEKLETWNTKEAMIDFARAILKKASEK